MPFTGTSPAARSISPGSRDGSSPCLGVTLDPSGDSPRRTAASLATAPLTEWTTIKGAEAH
jgi:hypothetical protein